MDFKLKAFLDLISFSEGTSKGLDNGYGVIVSGIDGPHSFTDYSDHPFAAGQPHILFKLPDIPDHYSSASGRYQLEIKWWPSYKKSLGLLDFGHDSQDAVALQQIRERHSIPLIEAGKIKDAITACSNIWASFPGNTYGQGNHSIEVLLTKYSELLNGG